ncbi:MAG: transcription antitermination factor NusB [Cytophagales bacterium]|nr:transcription antitermination factor NusB [Bernardetiaceae bacterium]MDW8209814.1 transcription antitermination factor NusB [Cytophagales bacterium]
MLTRRLLRAKVVQNFYAYLQCLQSDYELALDKIATDFLPDLNSMEVQDPVQLARGKQEAQALFKEQYQTKTLRLDRPVEAKVQQSALQAIEFYHQSLKQDYDYLKRALLRETEKIFEYYLRFLLLLVEFSQQAKKDYQEKLNRRFTTSVIIEYHFKLSKNPILLQLAAHRTLKEEALRKNISWNSDLVRKWYKLLLKEEFYQQYCQLPQASAEEELDVVIKIVKLFMLANEEVVSYFEEGDICWADNQSIVKKMTIKTLKQIAQSSPEEEVPLQELSPHWEEDKVFMLELFAKGVEEMQFAQEIIAQRTQNWDIDRITLLDKVILNLAISEMMHFPNIPIKVTINEFIEISKKYSTPKSYFFVNGLLHTIANDLQQMGKIKKSGRGLIDNK